MFCSARTRIHLRADNGPWKENYNQSRGRKEGTAHPLQPNILIYKESIKYLKSKVASQSARWWLDWGISVYLLPYSIPPVHFHIAPSFHLSVHFCFFLFFLCLHHFRTSPNSSLPLFYFLSLCPHLFHPCISVLRCSSNLCQCSSCKSILVNIVWPYSSSRRTWSAEFLSTNWLAILTSRPCTKCP